MIKLITRETTTITTCSTNSLACFINWAPVKVTIPTTTE